MGVFSVEISIADLERSRWRTLDALVDTGAVFSSAPASALSELGIQPITRRRFRSAHGEPVEMDVGEARIRVNGDETLTFIIFGEEDSTPLLGAHALEGLLLAVDPYSQSLIEIEGRI